VPWGLGTTPATVPRCATDGRPRRSVSNHSCCDGRDRRPACGAGNRPALRRPHATPWTAARTPPSRVSAPAPMTTATRMKAVVAAPRSPPARLEVRSPREEVAGGFLGGGLRGMGQGKDTRAGRLSARSATSSGVRVDRCMEDRLTTAPATIRVRTMVGWKQRPEDGCRATHPGIEWNDEGSRGPSEMAGLSLRPPGLTPEPRQVPRRDVETTREDDPREAPLADHGCAPRRRRARLHRSAPPGGGGGRLGRDR
jgi:hypothetical protein